MAPKFGTSGLRGLVSELTDALVADYVTAFCRACDTGPALYLGRDLRESSPRIAAAATEAARACGIDVVDCGVLPTPALALAAGAAGAGAIMVTGSHIPADRNGLKFYTPAGEITKDDEAAITASLGSGAPEDAPGRLSAADALGAYRDRYLSAFGPGALAGLRLGIYQHSSVARDVLAEIVSALGAEAVPLARSEVFVPVDTEAVDPDTRSQLGRWTADHGLDAILSTDGDGDRPMLTDGTGRLVPGDILGPLAARFLGARRIVTPVSSNSAVDGMGFDSVTRTRIGSPFVIAGMQEVGGAVAGYEPNGGFLLGFEAEGPAGTLAPLMTRDCALPMIAALAMARAEGTDLAGLRAALPPRFTAADRLQGVATPAATALIAALTRSAPARADFFDAGAETGLDLTDGLRVSFEGGEVVHLRPSGNAPEFRVYAEAATEDRAAALVARHMEIVKARLA